MNAKHRSNCSSQAANSVRSDLQNRLEVYGTLGVTGRVLQPQGLSSPAQVLAFVRHACRHSVRLIVLAGALHE